MQLDPPPPPPPKKKKKKKKKKWTFKIDTRKCKI